MVTFTSSLPKELLVKLDEFAKKLSIPKNKIIERALQVYLDQLVRAEYAKSYAKAKEDESLIEIAEEGIEVYYKKLEE